MPETKKALMLASVASMIDQFNIPNIKLLQSLGYHVDVVADFTNPGNISSERAKELSKKLEEMGISVIDIPIPRSLNPFALIKAYRLVKSRIFMEHYNLIHCHSPIGGAIARLAARKERKKGTRVIYTAHGFHFYTGAPIKNWVVYYPVEKWLSKYTDTLITINKEDYKRAKEKFECDNVVYVPGIGIDTAKINSVQKDENIRLELGIKENDVLLLSVGELNDNKNHEAVIRALATLTDQVYYVIVGKGSKEKYLRDLATQLRIQNRVFFAGFRKDVLKFYHAADFFVFPSFREGLSVALMEAMASGLPIVCSKIRGNVDLIDENGGFFFDPTDYYSIAESIKSEIDADREEQMKYNLQKIKQFDIKQVEKNMLEIYRKAD